MTFNVSAYVQQTPCVFIWQTDVFAQEQKAFLGKEHTLSLAKNINIVLRQICTRAFMKDCARMSPPAMLRLCTVPVKSTVGQLPRDMCYIHCAIFKQRAYPLTLSRRRNVAPDILKELFGSLLVETKNLTIITTA